MQFEYSSYRFTPQMLNNKREEGISAFMRIRDGEDFLKLTIESHIHFFDEIIACYNQCTDNTEKILLTLQNKYPDKLKVYHYEPKVYPLGSPQQKAFANKTSKIDTIHSMANYYNFALSKTTKKIAVKLDDDHLAVPENLSKALKIVRKNGKNNLYNFSGINLLSKNHEIGVSYNSAFSGSGDIVFFPVSNKSIFINGEIHELFTSRKLNLPARYLGLLYLHLKFLKKDKGLKNYEIDDSENIDNPLHNLVDIIKHNLIFISMEKFTETPLEQFQQLSTYSYKSLVLLKYPLLAKLVSKIQKSNLPLNRALTFKQNIQPILTNWGKIKNTLKKKKINTTNLYK